MLEPDATVSPLDDPDALRDPAAYYRDYYDHAPDMYLSVDAQTGTLVDCNATMSRITGYGRDEIVGRPILALYAPASRARARQAFQVFVAAGEVHGVELQVLCKDGRVLDVSLSATAVRDAAGNVVRSRSTWRDISEQKHREEQLRASEARFAAIFHSSPVALHLTSITTGEIIDVNAAAANLLSYSREEMIGRKWLDLGLLPDGAPLMAIAQVELGKAVPVTINSRSGPSRSCLATAHTISVDGEPCMLVTTIDITEREQAEREHSFLAAIVESSFDAVIGCDLNGMVVSWNAAAEQMFGYSAGEVIGRHISFQIPPTRLPEFQDALGRLAHGDAFVSVETQRLAKDGRLIDVTSNRFPVRDLQGEVLGVCIVAHDISEQKRMERALRASEEKHRFLTENMKDVVWTLDLDEGTTIYVSPSILQMNGYTQEEYMAAPLSVFFAAASQRRLAEEVARLRSGGDAAGDVAGDVAGGQSSHQYYSVELEAVHKDGSALWVEAIAFLARSAQTGHLELHGVSRDITARKRAEAALQVSERRLHLAARAAGLGIWHWNFADDSLEWDERMCELYAVPEEERTARRYYDAWRSRLHPDDRALAEASNSAALVAGSEWDAAFRIVLPDGRVRHIHASSVIERDDQGQARRMVGVNQDVTEQKMYEQLLEDTNAELERQVAARTAELRASVAELQLANAGKDAFLASISHELRTPLMGVLSMAETLAAEVRGPLNADQARYVAAIDESGHRLLETLNNVLLYTQVIAGGSVTREPCILADLSAAAVQTVGPKARRKNQLITQAVEPPDLEIDSDAQGLYNMLRMLLDNAIKFTPEGGRIEVAIAAQTVETGETGGAGAAAGGAARAVRIVVTDTGIGMTPAEIAGLFRPFGQIDKTLSRRYEGLGIGLAYVHNMARLLGGSVAVASPPEGGSRFTVTLPY